MKHLEVSCGIIIRDQQVLCVQRNIGKYDDVSLKWEFPGGKVEENETDFDALRREIKEEMDWDIYVGSKLGNIKYDYPDFSIVLSAYDCMARNEDFKLLEHIDSRWLTKEDFDSIEWTAADKELIKEIWK